ncbi:MAG TPA: hypothetical protein VIT44_13895 [Cyclobacteriaceae bacterium]
MNDQDKEQIKFNTETLKLLVLLFIATSGGSLALIADGIDAAREVVLSVLGMIFSVGLGILAVTIYKDTQRLLNE